MKHLKNLKYSTVKSMCRIIDCKPTELESMLDEKWSVHDSDTLDTIAFDYIADSVEYFSVAFLAYQTGLPEIIFKTLQASESSGTHEAVVALIEATCGMGEFVAEALKNDGRPHFTSSYDGIEYEIENSDLILIRAS